MEPDNTPTNQLPPLGPSPAAPNYGAYGPQPAVAGTDPPSGVPLPGPQLAVPEAPPPASMSGSQVYSNQPQPTASPTPQKINPNSTQNSLQIAEIRDGIVVMNDGSFRSVIMVKSINFDLMSPQEREAVENSYQGFLNSLYFPVQIFVRSERIDLRPYIERLDKIRSEHDNMLLSVLMDDYINFIANLSSQTNIMDKRFYVVVPYFPVADIGKAITQSKNFFTGLAGLFSNKAQHVNINEAELAKAKDELRNRVQAVLAGFQQCSVQGLPLDTQELIELYYDTYNPDTATRQQLKNFDDLNVPVIEKGQGNAPQPQLEKELL